MPWSYAPGGWPLARATLIGVQDGTPKAHSQAHSLSCLCIFLPDPRSGNHPRVHVGVRSQMSRSRLFSLARPLPFPVAYSRQSSLQTSPCRYGQVLTCVAFPCHRLVCDDGPPGHPAQFDDDDDDDVVARCGVSPKPCLRAALAYTSSPSSSLVFPVFPWPSASFPPCVQHLPSSLLFFLPPCSSLLLLSSRL